MERSSNLTVRTKGDGGRTAVPAVAGEDDAQWGRTTATTGLRRRALVLRDAEEGQEVNSATGFVAERRGRGGGLAGACWEFGRAGGEELGVEPRPNQAPPERPGPGGVL
jgi:hypothetical protein